MAVRYSMYMQGEDWVIAYVISRMLLSMKMYYGMPYYDMDYVIAIINEIWK